MKLTREQYREIFNKLPKEIQDVCASSETSGHIFQIAEKHKLHIDEAGVVHDIVMDVVMGIIPAKNMIDEIIKELKLAPLVASALLRDINDEILAPIKDTMLKIYKESNPFKPKTMQYADEYDEDDIHLEKESLLHEIENPTPVISKKEESIAISFNTKKEEKPQEIKVEIKKEPKKEPEIPDVLKQKRESLLSKITDAKLSSVVRMTDHMQDSVTQVSEEGMINQVETPNLYKVIKEEKTEKAKTLIDPFRASFNSKNITNTAPSIAPEKNPAEVISDPYREAI